MSDVKKRYNCLVYLDTTAQVSFEVLEAKLLEELKVPRLSMFYTDEEGDDVSIDSQEELDEAMKETSNDLLCVRVCSQGLGQCATGSGSHYSQLAQLVGGERKASTESDKSCPPKWFTPALSENNAYLLDEINKAFNEAVIVLSSLYSAPGSSPGVTGGDRKVQVMHYNVACDCCHQPIYGVRYKCGNCVNYDLCEGCEGRSQDVHCPNHVFLKVKMPTPPYSHSSKPLLRKNLYCLSQEDGEEAGEETDSSGLDGSTPPHPECVLKTREELKEEIKRRKLEKKMATKGAGPEGATPTTTEGTCAAPCVEKTREELKEEIRRKKLERKMAAAHATLSPHGCGEKALKHDLKVLKMEMKKKKKIAKLQTHGVLIPGMVAGPAYKGGSAWDDGKSHKGPSKYMAATVVADRNYPIGSVIPCGKPFEKSWVVANTGTKTWKDVRLVHQVGYTPVSTEIDVPDLNPEEQTILTVEYPPIGVGQGTQITSSWRLIRKGHTPFGPTLWLSVLCDREVTSPQGTTGTSHPQPPPPAPISTTSAFVPTGSLPFVAPPIPQQQAVFVASTPLGGATEGAKGDGDQRDVMTSSMCSEKLMQTFELVSQVSQKSSVPASEIDLSDRPYDEDQLGASDDEFVVVIPDCFNLEVPLPEITSLRSSICEEPAGCRDSIPVILNDAPLGGSSDLCGDCVGVQGGALGNKQTVVGGEGGCDGAGDVDSSEIGGDGCGHEGSDKCGGDDDGCGDECGGDDGCGGPINSESDGAVGTLSSDVVEAVSHQLRAVPPPQQDSSSPSGDRKLLPPRTTPTAVTGGYRFTLHEMSLRRVMDARITNPITILTAAINTTTKLVSEGVHISSSRGPAVPPSGAIATPPSGPLVEEDKFEDAPEPSDKPCPQAPPTTTSTTTQAPHITSYLDRDVLRFLPQSVTWEQPRWEPPSPSSPMDRLIGMGFANRELNSQLLEKHGNSIQAVLNELLDERNSEAVRV